MLLSILQVAVNMQTGFSASANQIVDSHQNI